jgi:hypothetical protein
MDADHQGGVEAPSLDQDSKFFDHLMDGRIDGGRVFPDALAGA